MDTFHGTTILSVRRDGAVALGGDGQVTLGNVVVKATARKVRRLYHDRVLAGFAGATADAFTLFERFEAKLEKHQGHLSRSAVELAKDWRSDRVLRRLEAMLAVADAHGLARSSRATATCWSRSSASSPSAPAVRTPRPPRGRCSSTPTLAAAGNRQGSADYRRRPLHLHQPASRDRSAEPPEAAHEHAPREGVP